MSLMDLLYDLSARVKLLERVEIPRGLTVIEHQTLAAGAASVTFSSIPQTFRSLQLIWAARGENASSSVALWCRLNGDTGANYDYSFNQTAGGANTPGTSVGQTVIRAGFFAAASAAAGLGGSGTILLPHYTSAFHKHLESDAAAATSTASGDMVREDGGGRWRSTAAVTSWTVLPSASNFAAGSRFTLYGLP